MIFLLWTPFIFCAGFMSHAVLEGMKRARFIHHQLNLPPPSADRAEVIRCNVENNKRLEVEYKRRSIRIVE